MFHQKSHDAQSHQWIDLQICWIGNNACNLTAVHVPPAAFKSSGPYNVLDDAVTIWAGLDMLPQDELYHRYVVAGMPDMTTSTCKCTIILLAQ